MSKFSPGPWYLEQDEWGAPRTVWRVISDHRRQNWQKHKTSARVPYLATALDHADARLIASAPEMYELLGLYVAQVPGRPGSAASILGERSRALLARIDGLGEGDAPKVEGLSPDSGPHWIREPGEDW